MKKTLALVILFSSISLSSYALPSEYSCDAGRYHIDLDLTGDQSTHLWLIDSNQRTVLGQGYAKSIERNDTRTRFFFYLPEGETTLTVNSADITNHPDFLVARVRGTAGGFILSDDFECQKR